MKMFLFYIVQFTWGLPQNLVGLVLYMLMYKKGKHERFYGSFVTYINTSKPFGGVSFGIFIFINSDKDDDWIRDTLIHEYGHTIQSLILGPLWFFVIALPSVVWCNLPTLIKYRKEKDISYYTLFCEGWANILGARFSGERFITDEHIKRGRFGKPFYGNTAQ